jgi:hypothetical protein
VELYASDRDVHDVRVGQRAAIDIPAMKELNGRRLNGVVIAVAPQPASQPMPGMLSMPVSPAAGAFRVTVALDSAQVRDFAPNALRAGYAVQGRVVTRSGTIAALAISYLRDEINKFR